MFGLDEVWRGDLDGNGTQDYIFFGAGPYLNGRTTPLSSLKILLMDEDGLPVPFFTVVYHGENGDGIKHLVDLGHDGHAELLISSYDENVSDVRAGPFCSGHWTNQLYKFQSLGVEEIRGMIGGFTFPFVHDWTYRGSACAELDKPFGTIQPATLGEHGTSREEELTTSIRGTKDGDMLVLDPVSGCKAVRAETVVVYDRAKTREIAFPGWLFSSYNVELADAIRRDGASVKLRGVNRMGNGDCTANLMWATGNTPAGLSR
jgi:hypothetical protein